ncbi:MAG: pilus assembly protein MshD [Methylophagaceae bacterium]
MSNKPGKQLGATLIELIITIVIISVALVGILSVVNFTTSHSADPLVQQQAIAVAESYLEEILAQSYSDPDGSEVGESRASFDDVDDYDGLSNNGCITTSASCPVLGDCVCDRAGDPIDSLNGYTITIAITTPTISGSTLQAVNVTVSRGSTQDISVTGYRANY